MMPSVTLLRSVALLLLLTHVASAQTAGCPAKCVAKRSTAKRACNTSACVLRPCRLDSKKAWTCSPVASTQKPSSRGFVFAPDFVYVDTIATIRVSLDLSRARTGDKSAAPEHFVVCEVDRKTGEYLDKEFQLFDDGPGENADEVKGNLVYSGDVSFREAVEFERLSFIAIPVFNGVEEPDSALVFQRNKALTVLPRPRGEGPDIGDATASVDSVDGLELGIVYSWLGEKGMKLHTNTKFLEKQVGEQCKARSSYVSRKSRKDHSKAIVRVGEAYRKGLWKGMTSIVLRAGWEGTSSEKSAVVSVVLRRAGSRGKSIGNRISVPIAPGSQTGCADAIVAVVNVDAGAEETTVTLSPMLLF